MKKARKFQKYLYFCFIDYAKAFDCVDHRKLENPSIDGNIKPPNQSHGKFICRSRSNSYNWTWNNRLVPNRERVHQGCILSPCSFNLFAEYIMQNAGLDETHAGIKIAGEISITRDMQMTSPLWQKEKN